MRNALHALTDELRRLKNAGVKNVSVSDESVATLRKLIAARRQAAGLAAGATGGGREIENRPQTGAAGTGAGAGAGGTAPSSGSGYVRKTAPDIVIKPYEAPAFSQTALTTKKSEAASVALPSPPRVNLPPGDKQTRWDALLAQVLNDQTCKANVRPEKKVVLGVGSLDAKIMFVGEAPGAEEEVKGEPFVGPAGQLLTKMIQGMGLKREDVYIGNIMNWRPQMGTINGRGEQVGNRPPTQEEMTYCLPYLKAQVEIVDPMLLVALGKTAVDGLLGFNRFKSLGEARSKWHDFGGKPLMVTYHPSYILREPTNKKKRLIWDDLLQVMEKAGLPISEKQRGFFLDK